MKNRKSNMITFLILFLIIGNVFFLASGTFFEEEKENIVFSNIGETKEFAGRNVTLTRWDYCESQQKMEVEFKVDNNAFDGFSNYEVSATTRDDQRLKVNYVIKEEDYMVVHLLNVPASCEIALKFQAKGYDSEYVKFFSNTKEAYKVDEIIERTKQEYSAIRLEREKELYNKEIEKYEEDIENNKKIIENVKNSNEKLKSNQIYQTKDEIEETNQKIENNDKYIKEIEEDIGKKEKECEEYKNKIKELDEKIKSLRGETVESKE